MKLKKLALRALGGLMSLALVACMLTSCSKSGSGDKLVENIPASAFMVVKINPQQIIENAGCTVDNGKIVLSQKYSDVIKQQAGAAALNVVNSYLAYTEGIKLDAIMVAVTADGSGIGVGMLSDAEPVKKHLKELLGNQSDEDGFVVFKASGHMVIAIKDNMIWWSDGLGSIKKQIEKAAESNIASLKGVGDILSDDNAFAMVINLPEANKKLAAHGEDIKSELTRNGVPAGLAAKLANVMDYYACGSLKFDRNTVSGEFYLIDKDGNRNEFGKMLNVIDTDFLKNVPADANAVMACGNIADPDVKKLIDDAAADFKSKPYNASDAQYLDLLTAWDGTAAIALECNSLAGADPVSMMNMSETALAEMVLKNLKFVAMAHYPADVVAKYTEMMCSFMQSSNMTPAQAADGLYSVAVPNVFDLYFGNENGYLTVANCNGGGNSSSLADKFTGKRFMMYSHYDANPTLAGFGWNFGSESALWLEADALKFRSELTGTDANFLQAIIEPLTDMNNLNKLMEYVGQMMSNMNYGADYDYDAYYDYGDYAEYEPAPEL